VYGIGKTFKFDAAHRLTGLPDGHKCSRVHGHTYALTIHLQRDRLDHVGFVRDYGDLAPIKQWVDGTLDHRDLNDIVPGNPTAEVIARWVYDTWAPTFPDMVAVTVCETAGTYAEYRP